jgi:hypothetical protein
LSIYYGRLGQPFSAISSLAMIFNLETMGIFHAERGGFIGLDAAYRRA